MYTGMVIANRGVLMKKRAMNTHHKSQGSMLPTYILPYILRIHGVDVAHLSPMASLYCGVTNVKGGNNNF